MRHLLNTLFVTTHGACLSRQGDAVLVRVEKKTRLHVPIHTLEGIVCLGRVLCTPGLLDLCGQKRIALSFFTEYGRFIARLEGPVSGNVLLRREQFRRADDPDASAAIALPIVAAKVANCRTALMRALRDHPELPGTPELQNAARSLQHLLGELESSPPLDVLRGREGDAARVYFAVFDHLITAQKDQFFFHARTRRPPKDNVNALLSFLYTLLAHDVASALHGVGLDPAVGYLHRDRPGRPGLALDLMEEFRALFADRLALSLINLRQVQADGFRTTETGAVQMDDATRKALLVAYQKRKQEEIRHAFLDETVPIGLLFYVQASLLARFLRGDLDAYPAFFWK